MSRIIAPVHAFGWALIAQQGSIGQHFALSLGVALHSSLIRAGGALCRKAHWINYSAGFELVALPCASSQCTVGAIDLSRSRGAGASSRFSSRDFAFFGVRTQPNRSELLSRHPAGGQGRGSGSSKHENLPWFLDQRPMRSPI
ncbi:hypothetical protein QCM77_09820 [Bradyrhizobium sp. SSUT18]|uniref:hypothetical protein n=1 Tax=Bradyrhizobium sp. SSUT18 TaxID=3040602 RepID=UPI0024485DF9|nr:hypothetical protein [Bradyrhizobium sp. SSUT18]MDH2400234.1 hypothetical protein [Bradyrhizobium sp. SSUT18]